MTPFQEHPHDLTLEPVEYNPFEHGELLLSAPSTEAQQEIWASVQMGEDASCAFNESLGLRLEGPLDKEAFERAFQALVTRHEALRMSLSSDGKRLCIVPDLRTTLLFEDLSQAALETRSARMEAIKKEEVETPFPLSFGPLFRARLVCSAPQEHAFLFTVHHIASDGWSNAVLLQDLSALYTSFRQGLPHKLEPAERISDYATHQNQVRQKGENQADIDYWLKRFEGEVPVLDLLSLEPRAPVRSYSGAREDRLLSSDIVEKLKNLSSQTSTTLFVTLLGGFQAFLYRITGQDDLVVGIPAAGQAAEGHTRLVGHCVHLLPLRHQIQGTASFKTLLGSLQETMFDAYDHQAFTFGSLVKALRLPRDLSRIPLVPVVFNIDQGTPPLEMGGLQTRFFSNPKRFSNFELSLNLVESGDSFVVECTYNRDLFDQETIRRRLAEFEALLGRAADEPEKPLGALTLLPDDEEELVLRTWNRTDQPLDSEATIPKLFEAQAHRVPSKIALECGSVKLSYETLNRRANGLALKLRKMGIGPESLVAIWMERSTQMVISMLAILKAGGAYLPLDPRYPKERVAFILEDAKASVVLTDARMAAFLPEHRAKTVAIDDDARGYDSETAPVSSLHADHLAYVIYTSGSTGTPKGVEVPQRSLVNLLKSVARKPGLAENDRLLSATTIAFDISVAEIFLPLTVGATLIVAGEPAMEGGDGLIEAIERTEPTFLQGTPALWRVLVDSGWKGSQKLNIVSAGEALPLELAQELLTRTNRVWNMYGPTEATIYATGQQVKETDSKIFIGHPIDNTQIYILDSNRQPTPIGIPGEIYIAGTGVARGYLGRKSLTDERFVPNPFSSTAGARMYRTGDIARFRPSGSIEYLGRSDHQVKLRGFRIELGEIEVVIGEHPAVARAVVMVREDRPKDQRLVAYYETESGQEVLDAQLRLLLAKKLPDYMVPQHFVPVEAFPLTPNGKVDKKALPSPKNQHADRKADAKPPQTPTEKGLAKIWVEVLNLEHLGREDSFFELGGHSLSAIGMLKRARDTFSVPLSLRDVFEAPSLSGLATHIDAIKYVREQNIETTPAEGREEIQI